MISLVRALRSDFQKLKHTPVFLIHVIIPIIGALIFLTYYNLYGRGENLLEQRSYFQILAIVFPLLIGLICGMVVSQEEQTGTFQVLLSGTRSRSTAYLSKLLLLFLLEVFSVLLALGVMIIGLKFVLHISNVSYSLYFKVFLWLTCSNIFIYILHLFISLQFGRGLSILLGIAGTLVAALMVTGLGDRCWMYLPWAWGVRFCDLTVANLIPELKNISSFLNYSIEKGMWIMIVTTWGAMISSLIWFNKWEGRKSYE